MVIMNYYVKKKWKNLIPEFIFTNLNDEYKAPEDTSEDMKKFLKIWHSMGGQYCKYKVIQHDMLKLESYSYNKSK